MKALLWVLSSVCVISSLGASEKEKRPLLSPSSVLVSQSVQNDWLQVPMTNIKRELQRFSYSDYKPIFKNKNKRLLVAVGTLPNELVKHIVYKMLDDDEEAAEKFVAMPMMKAFEEFQQVKKTFAQYPELHNKSMGMFFKLSLQQQQRILEMFQQTTAQHLFLGRIGMTKNEIEELHKFDDAIHEEFVDGQEVIEIDEKIHQEYSFFTSEKGCKVICCVGSCIGIFGIGLGSFLHFGVGAPTTVTLIIVGSVCGGAPLLILGGCYLNIVYELKDTAQKRVL